jgi:hypothetical protein
MQRDEVLRLAAKLLADRDAARSFVAGLGGGALYQLLCELTALVHTDANGAIRNFAKVVGEKADAASVRAFVRALDDRRAVTCARAIADRMNGDPDCTVTVHFGTTDGRPRGWRRRGPHPGDD